MVDAILACMDALSSLERTLMEAGALYNVTGFGHGPALGKALLFPSPGCRDTAPRLVDLALPRSPQLTTGKCGGPVSEGRE
jgi:hypothetical protein